jgi:4-amino-4-deoxy-L-arabinose transferase-like glycosyltransferase
MTSARAAFDRATLAFLGVLIVLTWLRIEALQVNPIGLYFDEAQYWMWSRTFDWGYFTKPPLIAWVIGATTALMNTDAEWAIRLGAPLAHAIAGIAIFALGRTMYGAWAGFWAGLGYLLAPAVFYSSTLISTDALLLPLWSLALFSMWRLTVTRSWWWAIALGLFVGVGALAKYAMLYFILCTGIAARWMPPVRAALAKGRGIIAFFIALAVLTPNIIWNIENGFATARHTASNARFDPGDMFHFDELFEFIVGQGIIGPVLFIILVGLGMQAWRRASGLSDEDKFLIAYMAPPFLIVAAIAFISRANANWAAVAYPAAIIWVTGSLYASLKGRRWIVASAVVNVIMAVVFAFVVLELPAWSNQAKGIRTTRAWEETAREIALRAAPQPGEPPFSAVLVDDRATYFELAYYWRDARRANVPLPPVRMWLLHGEAQNSAEATDPMRPEEGGRVLVVHLTPDYLPFVAGDFTVFRTVEHLTVPLGGDVNRELEISVGEGFAPAPRDEAFAQRLHDQREQNR